MKRYLVLLGLCFLLFLVIYIVDVFLFKTKQLKIYNPVDIVPELVDDTKQSIKYNHTIAEFRLIDQDSNMFTSKSLKNKIYVADFFFATCKTICPKMATQMKRVYSNYKADDQVSIVSHTVMPEYDRPSVLKAYATSIGVQDFKKWHFVTGSKQDIYNLARKSYLVGLVKPGMPKPQFIHTENFVLVDKQKQIRGFYDGTSKQQVDKLIKDIGTLKQEYED